jgi:acyl carrier protein
LFYEISGKLNEIKIMTYKVLKEETEFIRNFANQFDDVNEIDISINTRFRDIEGWSSINALMIMSMVDEVYNISLSGEDILNSVTVEDIYNIVIAKK